MLDRYRNPERGIVVKRINPHTIEQHNRRAKALRLRAARMGWDEIAKECGYYDGGTASKAVQVALSQQIREPAAEVVAMELETIDVLLRPQIAKAVRGDTQAALAALKILERKHRMLGIDAAPSAPEAGDKITEVIISGSLLTGKTEPAEHLIVDVDTAEVY